MTLQYAVVIMITIDLASLSISFRFQRNNNPMQYMRYVSRWVYKVRRFDIIITWSRVTSGTGHGHISYVSS